MAIPANPPTKDPTLLNVIQLHINIAYNYSDITGGSFVFGARAFKVVLPMMQFQRLSGTNS
jgi:hypothetical protein